MDKSEKHEYKCETCKHQIEGKCIRVQAFLMANVYPYSDGCNDYEEGIKAVKI